MTDQPTADVPQRNAVLRGVCWAASLLFLLAAFGAAQFSVESFNDRDATLDLVAAVLLLFAAIPLGWVAAVCRRTNTMDRQPPRKRLR